MSVYTNIPPASTGASVSADWFGMCQNAFATATGLDKSLFTEVARSKTGDSSQGTGSTWGGFQLAGTSTAVYTNLGMGGIVQADASATGYADWAMAGGTLWQAIPNVRTKRWAVFYRLTIGSTPAANSKFSAGIYTGGGTPYVGLGYAGAVSTWRAGRGAEAMATVVVDTGVAITVSAGGTAGYRTISIGNVDLTNWSYNMDVAASSSYSAVEAVSNLPNLAATPYIRNAGTDPLRYYHNRAVAYVEF